MSAGGRDGKVTLARLEQRLSELPLLPAVLLELMKLDRDADDHFEKVGALVARDPALATRVLRAANSAAIARGRTILRLTDAVSRMGSVAVVNLVIADSMAQVFVPGQDWERALWVHALAVAVVARTLAAAAQPGPTVDVDLCYLGGLLHDVGRFVLYLEAPAELRAVDDTDWDTPATMLAAETAICGFTHAELGHRAALKWRLPAELQRIIRYHHTAPPYPIELGAELARVVRIINFADRIAISAVRCPTWPTLTPDELTTVAALGPAGPPLDKPLAAAFAEVADLIQVLGLAPPA